MSGAVEVASLYVIPQSLQDGRAGAMIPESTPNMILSGLLTDNLLCHRTIEGTASPRGLLDADGCFALTRLAQ